MDEENLKGLRQLTSLDKIDRDRQKCKFQFMLISGLEKKQSKNEYQA